MPFRQAHQVTGKIVALAETRGLPLARLPLDQMREIEAGITSDVYSVLSAVKSVRSRTSYGGTAPSNVRKMARRWIRRLEREAASG